MAKRNFDYSIGGIGGISLEVCLSDGKEKNCCNNTQVSSQNIDN